MNEFKDYYKILGISKDASADEIKKSYRKLAGMYHPDRHSELSEDDPKYKEYEAKMKEINEAYEVLGNKKSRIEYDNEYEAYHEKLRREERRQQESARWGRERRTSDRTYNQNTGRRTSYGYSATYEDDYDDEYDDEIDLDYLKQVWDEVREEEKAHPFMKRHKKLSRRMNKDREFESYSKEFIILFEHGIIHVANELYHQLSKLAKRKDDSAPKYVIRNRKSIAAIILASTIAFGGVGGSANTNNSKSNDDVSISTEYNIDDEDDKSSPMSENVDTIVDGLYSQIHMNRYYKIKLGDTLSQLAEDWEVSLSSIENANNISNPNLIQGGMTIKIPYVISDDDFDYYTEKVTLTEEQLGRKDFLNALATEYNTDVETLYSLNPEAIRKDGDTYILESSSISVPKFAKKSEVKAQKESQKTNQY